MNGTRTVAVLLAGFVLMGLSCGGDDDDASEEGPSTEEAMGVPATADPTEDSTPETAPPDDSGASPTTSEPTPPTTEDSSPDATGGDSAEGTGDDTGTPTEPRTWADATDIERIAALAFGDLEEPDTTVTAAYEGGTPVEGGEGLLITGYAAFRVPTGDIDPTLLGAPPTWTEVSAFSAEYSQNVPEQTVIVMTLNRDPEECGFLCGVNLFGTQPGASTIAESSELPVWLPGSSTFIEPTWSPDGRVIDVFGIGNAEGTFDPFTNPGFLGRNCSEAGHLLVAVAPFEVSGIAAFNAETPNPAEAYAQVVGLSDIELLDETLFGPDSSFEQRRRQREMDAQVQEFMRTF